MQKVTPKMTLLCAFSLLAALAWGFGWSTFLTRTRYGSWLARRRSWLAAAISVMVDLALMRPLLSEVAWRRVAAITGLTSIGFILRGLATEYAYDRAQWQWVRDDEE